MLCIEFYLKYFDGEIKHIFNGLSDMQISSQITFSGLSFFGINLLAFFIYSGYQIFCIVFYTISADRIFLNLIDSLKCLPFQRSF